MKTIVFCGGQGTRLKEETEYRPKPLVEVGGRPILWHIMKLFSYHGFQEFIMCLGYRGNMIKEYFLNYEAFNSDFSIKLGNLHALAYHGSHEEQDYTVTLVDTGLNTMTGGRLKRVRRYVNGDSFFATYGDGLADVNLRDLLAFHQAHGRVATVTTVQPLSRFGVLDIDGNGRVNDFSEKPQMDGWINAGYFVFHRRIFEYIDGDECILERAPLEKLAKDGQLMAYRHKGFFQAMDTYREYLALNELWSKGEAPWKIWS